VNLSEYRSNSTKNEYYTEKLKSNSTIPVSLSAGKELFYSVSKLDFDDFGTHF
jgi:hypothetical protein